MDGQYGQTWTLDEPGRTDLSVSTTVDDLLILLRLIQFQKDIYDHLNLTSYLHPLEPADFVHRRWATVLRTV